MVDGHGELPTVMLDKHGFYFITTPLMLSFLNESFCMGIVGREGTN
jgi:hypothetical protein